MPLNATDVYITLDRAWLAMLLLVIAASTPHPPTLLTILDSQLFALVKASLRQTFTYLTKNGSRYL